MIVLGLEVPELDPNDCQMEEHLSPGQRKILCFMSKEFRAALLTMKGEEQEALIRVHKRDWVDIVFARHLADPDSHYMTVPTWEVEKIEWQPEARPELLMAAMVRNILGAFVGRYSAHLGKRRMELEHEEFIALDVSIAMRRALADLDNFFALDEEDEYDLLETAEQTHAEFKDWHQNHNLADLKRIVEEEEGHGG